MFTKGLFDRENGRLHEEEWIEMFRRLRESVFPCPICGRDIVLDVQRLEDRGRIGCWHPRCKGHGQSLDLPPRLKIKAGNRERSVVLNAATKLLRYQLLAREYDLERGDAVVGEVVQNPNDPAKWGLRNLSSENWQVILPDGNVSDVQSGKAFGLATGLKIDFKTAVAEII